MLESGCSMRVFRANLNKLHNISRNVDYHSCKTILSIPYGQGWLFLDLSCYYSYYSSHLLLASTNRHGHHASSQLYSRLTSSEPYYVTWSDKTGLLSKTGSQIFDTNTKLCKCTIRFQCQTQHVIVSLFLLAAFAWPSGDLYEQFDGAMGCQQCELFVPIKSLCAG